MLENQIADMPQSQRNSVMSSMSMYEGKDELQMMRELKEKDVLIAQIQQEFEELQAYAAKRIKQKKKEIDELADENN